MCIVCVQWERGKLTNREAFRAVQEFIQTDRENQPEEVSHWFEVQNKISEAIVEELISSKVE